jgi:hypothetical protein
VVEPIAQGPIETKEEIEAEIRRVFGRLAEEALCIARAESGLRADAQNDQTNIPVGSVDRGVFQLNDYWQSQVSDADAYDARANIAAAKRIHDSWGSWQAWTTHLQCGL